MRWVLPRRHFKLMRKSAASGGTEHPSFGDTRKCGSDLEIAISIGAAVYFGNP